MRLKSLEIQGFKSFPNKTTLLFEDSITAVVGPNGCGKSNIADAVRWVLGEQSSKALRGAKMEDVIFGGSAGRRAMGVCYVTLGVDNTSRALPIAEDEVLITRKIYRDGESEYRINGAVVRLKDIHQLFMDTGLGRDGYSIIGQGKVAELLSTKSADRREVFEEAAGISKFRYRREEAEKRLSSAEDNITRLTDILNELESRLAPLKRESEKAEKFLKLSEEKRLLEISLWLLELEEVKIKRNTAEDNELVKREEYEAVLSEVEQSEKELEEHSQEMFRLSSLIDRLSVSVRELTEERGNLRSEIAVIENNITHGETAVKEQEALLATLEISGETLNAHRQTAQQDITEVKRELLENSAQITEKQNKLMAVRHALTEKQGETAKTRINYSELLEAIQKEKLDQSSYTAAENESERRLEEVAASLLDMEKLLSELTKEKHEAEGFLTELDEQRTRFENSRQGYLLRENNIKSQLEKQLAAMSDIERTLNEARSRTKILRDLEQSYEGFGAAVKYILKQAGNSLDGVCGAVSSLISTDSKYVTAVEIALGGSVQSIVVENEVTAKRAVSMLTSSKAGRATFLPLDTIKGRPITISRSYDGFLGLASEVITFDERYRGVMENLLGRTLIAEDLDTATKIAKAEGYRYRVVSLDGQVVNAYGSITGGYLNRSVGVLSRKNEIAELEKRTETLTNRLTEASAKADEVKADLAKNSAEVKTITDNIETIKEDIALGKTNLMRTTTELKSLEEQKQTAVRTREQIKKRLEEYSNLGLGLEMRIKILSEEASELQKRLAIDEKELATMTSEQELITSALSSAEMTVALKRQKLTATEENYRKLTEDSEQKSAQREAALSKIRDLGAAKITSEQQMVANSVRSDEVDRLISEQERALSTAMNDRLTHEKESTTARNAERELTTRRDNLYRELVHLTETKNSLIAMSDSLVRSLWEEYELTVNDAKLTAKSDVDKREANIALTSVKGSIKELGNVNVAATEEYAEVSMRYETLSTQLSDLNTSKQDLERLISSLTGSMTDIFNTRFAEISKHFSEIFVRLFGGGKGELYLTDKQNPLECGIEIEVSPPGKMIKNLGVLSGGEQALVAISIIFAILKVNPSPFCVMDEVEAALDDVNVTRFASYLRSVTDRTQFILITHRRGTMEAADILYGVTMQEEGVSRLLKLELKEAGNLGSLT